MSEDFVWITKERAVLIAQQACEEQGWTWMAPVHVQQFGGNWVIQTNWRKRGCNARFKIDCQTGVVKGKAFLPR